MKKYISKSDNILTLYHGSKSGIVRDIAPSSRDCCDFGKGFYMGTEITQPLSLICNYPDAKLYTLNIDLSGLNILEFDVCLDWALFVAYNRGKLDSIKGSAIYKKYAEASYDTDVVIGYIANDRMFVVLDRFFNGEITDMALIHSLSALNLGKQYVSLTKNACDRITISKIQELTEDERNIFKTQSEDNRQSGFNLANEICIKYRRAGLFFDEILKKGL